ncbi:fam13, putative [Ixodes scapularis]|uniref:Fam13, putative n=1 Tax=Ixodes scapularis TaxID=6945 RepID=B7PZP8_IXOSC|nr:fam13, putative [Ixodes scapularis]|eukprot:XP_002405864.1 fam13, putative [Ixodes scapularis]
MAYPAAGMAQEGLFRVSGNARLVEKLKWSFDHTGDAPLETEGDVAAVAALLKLLFRELPEPLMPSGMHPAFLDAIQEGEWVSLCSIASVHDREECTRRLKCLVEQLPPGNFGVLKYLCHFLNRVAQSEKLTRMTPSALGIVFGPNLFRFAEDLQGLKEQAVTNQVVTCFIADYHSIFEGDAELSCTADSSMNVEGSSSSSKANGRVSKAKILETYSKAHSLTHSWIRAPTYPDFEATLITWFQNTTVAYLFVDDTSSREKANDSAFQLSRKEIECNNECFSRFEERNNLTLPTVCGESGSADKTEWPPAPRSSSEERPPAGGSLMEPHLASRRCSSHEEVAILDSAQGHTPKPTGSPCGGAASSEEANRDLSPHPPQPKRRELETPSTSSQESASQDWHEACRSAERLTPFLRGTSIANLHLDPSLPPSPPVEQDDFLKSNFKEEEANLTTIKQLSKKIHSLKKKVKQFEENFEKEHGYRPSHAEKMNHSEVKKLLLELNKLRKDVKNLREENSLPEPAYLSFSSWSRDQSKLGREPDENNGRPTRVMEKALNDTLTSLAEKRRMAQRPDSVDDMTREQVLEEKLAIQKALLRFESLHGRPSRRADRNLMRPLYDRYRNVKRLVGRAPPLAKGKDSELQPILEHVAMNFTSPQPRSPPQELEEGLELMPSMSAIKENLQEAPEDDCVADKAELVEQASGVLEKYNDSNLHELPL